METLAAGAVILPSAPRQGAAGALMLGPADSAWGLSSTASVPGGTEFSPETLVDSTRGVR